MSSKTGAIKKKGSRESARLNPSGQELLLTGLSPRVPPNTSVPSVSNNNNSTSRSELSRPQSTEVPLFTTAQTTSQNPGLVDMDNALHSRPLIARTPQASVSQMENSVQNMEPMLEQSQPRDIDDNLLNDTSGIGPLNTSSESNSLRAPTYSSLSGLGADFVESDHSIQTIRNTHIPEKGNTNSNTETREFSSVPSDLKAYINYTLVNAFESYSRTISSSISESVQKTVRSDFLEFLSDINKATLPLRREEPPIKTFQNPTGNKKAPEPNPQHQKSKTQQTKQNTKHLQQNSQPQHNIVNSNSQQQVYQKNPFQQQTFQNLNNPHQQNYINMQQPNYNNSQFQKNYLQNQQTYQNHQFQQQQSSNSFPPQQFNNPALKPPPPPPTISPIQQQQFPQNPSYEYPQQQSQIPTQNFQQTNIPAVSQTSFAFKPIQGLIPNPEVQPQVQFPSYNPEVGNMISSQQSPMAMNNNYYNRSYKDVIKIDRWNLKFDGTPDNLSVEDFIFRLETLQQQYNCPWSEILKQLHLTLTGDAATWYYQFHKTNHQPDWPSMREALLLHYRSCKSDYQILRELSDRKQGLSESCDKYFAAIMKIKSQLKISLPDSELIKMVKGNLNDRIGPLVYPMSIFSLDQLRFVCKEAENTFPIHSSHSNRQFRPAPRVHANEIFYDDNIQMHYEDNIAAMQYINNNRPRPPNKVLICWNCKVAGHLYWECPSPKQNIFCFKCGEENFIVANCPKCKQKNGQKNVIPTGESRSKQPPELSNPQI